MTDFDSDLDGIPLDLEAMVDDAIDQILAHEDPLLFLSWMREHIYDYYTDPEEYQPGLFSEPPTVDPNRFVMDSAMARALATSFACMIWNGIPLPTNHFRPKPMTMPKRNDPCHCGSGKKYKHCCSQLPAIPSLSENEIWPVLFEKLDAQVAERAIREHHVPLGTLNLIAHDYLDSEQPKKALALLKPLFEGVIRKTNDDAEFALTLLCNAYDFLGYHKKKAALLRSIIDTVPRSPLRSGAWQRQATIRIDNDDADGAWVAFQNAQRDDPDAISLSVLEVQILNAQGRNEKCAERADFWVRRLRRAGLQDSEMPLTFLIDVVETPTGAFADLGLEMTGDAGRSLRQWLESVLERPVPKYTVSNPVGPVDPGDEHGSEALRKQFLSHGMEGDQIEDTLRSLINQYDEIDDAGEDPEDDILMLETGGMSLQTPDKLQELEKRWHAVFPMAKPFSVQEVPFGEYDPWGVGEELEWSGWLLGNPAAFDSLDILDDLATALIMHPQMGAVWIDDTLLKPILQRAETILAKVFVEAGEPQLNWLMPENRPALRALSRLADMTITTGEPSESLRMAQRMIAINPRDNQGYRMIVMNQLIRESRDEEALQLAGNYPDDINPEVAFGKVLALFRLGRQKEAVEALGDSLEMLDKIPRYLIAKRVKKPKLNPDGIMFGGDDQAWYYREEMRGVWQKTPGALEWLKKAEKVFR